MAKYNKSNAPYYDYYDHRHVSNSLPEKDKLSEKEKGYTHLLAVPGRVAQARELTTIQSMTKDIIKSIGDSIMKDGDIVEGCQVSVNAEKTKAHITEGRVYINGIVLPVTAQEVVLSGNYNDSTEVRETIGFILEESVVYETNDASLRDPAQSYDNYNQAGCHRIKSVVKIVKDDPTAAPLVTLINGVVTVEKYAGNYDSLTNTLARRTYDESGSYIVDGLTVRIEPNQSNTNLINVVVESGKAYVLGREIRLPSNIRKPVNRSTEILPDTRYSNYENQEQTIILSSIPYVKTITAVRGCKFYSLALNGNQATQEGSEYRQTIDSNKKAEEIKSVYDTSASPNTEIDPSKYTLVSSDNSGSDIIWKEVPPSSYRVEYTVLETIGPIAAGEENNNEYYRLEESRYLRWNSGMLDSESLPIIDTDTVEVDFTVSQARKDIVCIDQFGEVSVVEGTPGVYGREVLPTPPVDCVVLAHIMHSPGAGASEVLVSNVGLTRFTMNDIQGLLSRIRNLEYNQTVSALNSSTRDHAILGTMKNIFTDPLVDFLHAHRGFTSQTLPDYDVMIDTDIGVCYLPVVSEIMDFLYDDLASTNSHKYSRLITLPKSSEEPEVILSQLSATSTFLVNPYTQFPQLPEISLDPAVDSWVDLNYVTVPVSKNSTEVVNVSTRHIEVRNTRGSRRPSVTTSSYADTAIGVEVDTTTTESVIAEEAVQYIRQREIEVIGSNYSGIMSLICEFDGVPVSLIPTGDSVAGDTYTFNGIEYSTVRTNGVGAFTAKFTIPENRLTGIREVVIRSIEPNYGVDATAFALYQASGLKQTIQRTVTTLTTVLLNRVTTVTTTHYVDPVGQTFVLDRMTMISGIDVYFAAAPSESIPITCDIREVVNGSITSTILGHKTLKGVPASQIDPNHGNIATRFEFDDPVLLEGNKEYAFVLRSVSNQYSIWVAELGQTDINTNDIVLSNPYLIGVMMSSSNNSSWTMHQNMDIKFRLLADTYADSAEVYFNQKSERTLGEGEDKGGYSSIYLMADSVVPNGTSVRWEYSVDNGMHYNAISPHDNRLLSRLVKEDVIIKAIMSRDLTTSPNLSPIIAADSIGATLAYYDSDVNGRYYVSETFNSTEYDTVDVIMSTYNPSNQTSISVNISTDNGNTLESIDPEVLIESSLQEWKETTYRFSLDSPAHSLKLFIGLNSSNKYETPAFSKLRVVTYVRSGN